MKAHHCALGLALVLALAACGGEEIVSAPETFTGIVTEDGRLTGITSPEINQYLGIPYAAAPVGALRWTPPQPHGAWEGVLEATQLGNPCPQIGLQGFGELIGDEDCLTLNVYTPGQKQDRSDRLPVMVWIHGGALVYGSARDYDPSPLVEKGNVIVVTLNYRLGYFGWFAHPALDAEDHLIANYGLMDQQFALQWVRRNITAFGGDPDRVTIFGESAGGLSVYSNLASPLAAGLFQGAIAQSGAYASFASYATLIAPLADAEAAGTTFAESVGCPQHTADCLRTIPAADIVPLQPALNVYPIVDGDVLVRPPGAAFASGDFNKVPVISGSNHDEWRYFIAFLYDLMGNPLTDADYPAAVSDLLMVPESDPIVQYLLNVGYPLTDYPPPPGVQSAPLALSALVTDSSFSCPAWNAARLLSQYVQTYAYEFNDPDAPRWSGLPQPSFPLGAYHSAEIPYLIDVGAPPVPVSFTADQQALSDAMISYWAQFARTGDPNSAATPHWAPYDVGGGELQSLKPPMPEAIASTDFYDDHKCAIWIPLP
jgi:para-nitrobenzyl esterase